VSSPPLALIGPAALSTSRLARTLAPLAAHGVASGRARWLYVVDAPRALDDHEARTLATLLELDTLTPAPAATLWVVPRLGTISPWSSKATEILGACGLGVVRRIERGVAWELGSDRAIDLPVAAAALHDRMTQTVLFSLGTLAAMFVDASPRPMQPIELGADPVATLAAVSQALGLALADDEIAYLAARYADLGRAPTDVELMMFAQANSEHCRHKIFNAAYTVDGAARDKSLFRLIRDTTAASPAGVLSAYKDNAAVIEGHEGTRLWPDAAGVYRTVTEPSHILGKVETHNHPTAISPFAGAATGSGGEIRDEGATGRGGKPKAGLTGFVVSNLRLPGAVKPWEGPAAAPGHIASPLEIMIDGPLGGAAFNNEFGRPAIAGYFRTLELTVPGDAPGVVRGFHKPVMLAGGIGAVRPGHVEKVAVRAGAPLVVLGGPAMLIGLGGGAASSVAAGAQAAELDFASVQRDNAEMERRCQEVIDRCIALGDASPIWSIHDVGAGGLSNALPELVHDQGLGASLDLRAIPSAEPGMSPRELWCNEAQERYVLALDPERLEVFAELCARERAPWARVGTATAASHLLVRDDVLGAPPVDLPLDVIFGKPPRMQRDAITMAPPAASPLALQGRSLESLLALVLALPAVGDKSFLITIGDRTVGGLVARDPFVGPWQVPVADCAVTLAGFEGHAGEAFAIGERPAVALLDAGAASRLAIAEAVLGLAGTTVGQLGNVKLSCNWMAAPAHPGEDARLYAAVEAASHFAQALGVAVPVGKDSMSMRTTWRDDAGARAVVSPVTLVATSFAPVHDVRRTATPADGRPGDDLVLVQLRAPGAGPRLGGSALAQALGTIATEPGDVAAAHVAALFAAMQALLAADVRVGYHDISDGGVIVTALELAWATGAGLHLACTPPAASGVGELFDETPGAIISVAPADRARVLELLHAYGLGEVVVEVIGRLTATPDVAVTLDGVPALRTSSSALRAHWSEVSYAIARLRDDAACADEEHAARLDPATPPLTAHVAFDMASDPAAPYLNVGARPRVAILREQGVNGQLEMAAAFTRAGFDAVDVHMSDVLAGRHDLRDMRGLAACGGFSYGDVLGAGRGWAMTILHNARARDAFAAFFARPDTFSLGVCNGCQMMASLRDIVPGASGWPSLRRNRSEQFEARLALVEVLPSPSILLADLVGSRLPIAVSHGEGRAVFAGPQHRDAAIVAARFVDGAGAVANRYPANPNGSEGGMTAWATTDGRATILMPHPERVFRTAQLSWHPREWGEASPWLRMFQRARRWVE
jgi:phosphoribosylformylglycinamidine synthase